MSFTRHPTDSSLSGLSYIHLFLSSFTKVQRTSQREFHRHSSMCANQTFKSNVTGNVWRWPLPWVHALWTFIPGDSPVFELRLLPQTADLPEYISEFSSWDVPESKAALNLGGTPPMSPVAGLGLLNHWSCSMFSENRRKSFQRSLTFLYSLDKYKNVTYI